jgi:hypothetical protein
VTAQTLGGRMPMDKPTYYEIKVKGHLDQSWAEFFPQISISNQENGEALLIGNLPDQAALQGVLNRIGDLGLILVSVNPSNR